MKIFSTKTEMIRFNVNESKRRLLKSSLAYYIKNTSGFKAHFNGYTFKGWLPKSQSTMQVAYVITIVLLDTAFYGCEKLTACTFHCVCEKINKTAKNTDHTKTNN